MRIFSGLRQPEGASRRGALETMQERRVSERRSANSKAPYLRYSSRGKVVFLDRRRMPDRRLNNIHAEFIPLYDFYK